MTQADLPIREAQPDDAEAFLAHMKRLITEPGNFIPKMPADYNPTVEQVYNNIAANYVALPNWALFVVEDEDKIIASLSLHGGRQIDDQNVAVLSIYIENNYRRKGLGRRLMEHAIAWSRQNNLVDQINLEVSSDNTPAISLYEKLGFKLKSRRRKTAPLNVPTVDILVMSLNL